MSFIFLDVKEVKLLGNLVILWRILEKKLANFTLH